MSILFGEFGNPGSAFDTIKKAFMSIWTEQELAEKKSDPGGAIATGQAGGFFPKVEPIYIPDQQRMFALSGYIWTDEGFPLDEEAARHSIIVAGNHLIDLDVLDLPDTWGGVFILVAMDFTTGTCWIAGDPAGLLPVYYASYNRNLLFSSHIRPLARSVQASIDPTGLVQNTAFHYTVGSRTMFTDIRRLNAGETLRFDHATGRVLLYQARGIYCSIDHYNSSSEMVDALWNDYLSGIRQITRAPGIHGLMLSGGFDTRLVTVGMRLCDKPITGFTLGELGAYEVEIAQHVAELARAKTTVYTPLAESDPPVERIRRLIDRAEWANFAYCETGAEVLKQQGAMSVSTGIGGETFFGGQAFSFMGKRWDQKARLLFGMRRAVGLPVDFYTPVSAEALELAKQDIQEYFRKQLRQSRPYFHPDWLEYVDNAIASIEDDISSELCRLNQNNPETLQQILERFWWEHHVLKEFGRQEITLATVLPLALPTLHHTFYKRCSNLDPAQKVDHGIYLKLVRKYFGAFASLPTANIPISLNNPDSLLWIARAYRSWQDRRIIQKQLQLKGRTNLRRYGWMNYEDWTRKTRFLINVADRVEGRIFNQAAIQEKAHRIIEWKERVYSSQELLMFITTSHLAAGFNV
ncbi:MAG: asparagine synthase-related protein [Anaerolineales bacterium]|nr:asparagine synthase-related protein [Anaerolineales bacterium]